MTAKSYLGTMCIGVATTGVEGLKTLFRKQPFPTGMHIIVPED